MMGMFDSIKDFKINCPECGEMVDDFQTKEGACILLDLDYWEVDTFYSECDKCHAWIEYYREHPPKIPVPITEYKMTWTVKE